MATRALGSKTWAAPLRHVAAARELARKYEVDRVDPLSTFVRDEAMDAELERLLNKLS